MNKPGNQLLSIGDAAAAPGMILHSDRGSQYCGGLFQDTLKADGMRSSMSRRGDCWDNAPTESLWDSL